MSRLQSAKMQRNTIEGLLDGSVDVVIGTHRILSKDVRSSRISAWSSSTRSSASACGRRKNSSSSSASSTC